MVNGVWKEVTFSTGLTINQSYWWDPTISTPVPTLEADRIARGWKTHAEPGANNVFYDLVPESIGAAAADVLDLIAVDEEEGEIEPVRAGGKRGEGGATPEGVEMIDSFGGTATSTDVSGRRL